MEVLLKIDINALDGLNKSVLERNDTVKRVGNRLKIYIDGMLGVEKARFIMFINTNISILNLNLLGTSSTPERKIDKFLDRIEEGYMLHMLVS